MLDDEKRTVTSIVVKKRLEKGNPLKSTTAPAKVVIKDNGIKFITTNII